MAEESETIGSAMTGNLPASVMAWLENVGHGNSQAVMARGKHYNFNCDGRNHYVYEIDESSREPGGRKKRVYIGVMAEKRELCRAESERWAMES